MDIQKEVGSFMHAHKEADYETIKAELGHDACKKIGAILDILEIGESSIAHSKLLLHVCEDLLEKCSLTMGTKRDV